MVFFFFQFNRETRKHALKSPQCCERQIKKNDLSRKLLHDSLRHIFVDRKNKLLYCFVPKVASTNLKRLLITLAGRGETAHTANAEEIGFEYLIQFSATYRDHMMKTFFKFLFVRDPIRRLVSAYRDKFVEPNAFFRREYGRAIVTKYRKNNLVTSSGLKSDVPTFQEFIRHILEKRNEDLDEHWIPIYDLCQPCMFSYDFIGSLENLELDLSALLTRSNVTRGI